MQVRPQGFFVGVMIPGSTYMYSIVMVISRPPE